MFKNKRMDTFEENLTLLNEHSVELGAGFQELADTVNTLRETVDALMQQITQIQVSDKQVSIVKQQDGMQVMLMDKSMSLNDLINVAETVLKRNQPIQTETPGRFYV